MDFTTIKSKVYILTKTNSTSFPIANLTLLANNAVERVASLINRADSRWQWDDSNQSDLPIATTAIVANQSDYTLATSHISIDRVEVKDTSGKWNLLDPIDQHQIRREALASYMPTPGIPLEYDTAGASVFLYPVANFSQAASLKVYFTRPPVAFTTADTIEVPGFNALFHDLVPLWVAYEYAMANSLKNVNLIFAKIEKLEAEILAFYGQRNRSERPRMTISTNGIGFQSGRLGRGGQDSNK